MTDPLTTVVRFYETLTVNSLDELRAIYTADAYFKDPFNEVRDIESIHRIFAHMFVSLDEPHFVINSKIAQANEAFLTWDFTFRIKRLKPKISQTIRGASHLRFNDAGCVIYHRDYWDAAEELYEKFPVIGGLLRFLKKRVG